MKGEHSYANHTALKKNSISNIIIYFLTFSIFPGAEEYIEDVNIATEFNQ
jgi:hypothetical protein